MCAGSTGGIIVDGTFGSRVYRAHVCPAWGDHDSIMVSVEGKRHVLTENEARTLSEVLRRFFLRRR